MRHYHIDYDGSFSGIMVCKDDRARSCQDAYTNIDDARRVLLDYLRSQRDDYNHAIKGIKTLRLKDIDD